LGKERYVEMTHSKPPEKPNASHSRTTLQAMVHVLVLIGCLAIYILFGLLLWVALNRYIDPQNSTQKGDVVQALALLMAGVAAAVGIYFTWRGQGITREGQRISQENIEVTRQNAEEQSQLTQEGQSTERFTRAIGQLAATDAKNGGKILEVRLGAIYELEQVSRVSKVLRASILEVLSAYLRQNTSWHHLRYERLEEEDKMIEAMPLPIDVQAILTVLGRRRGYFEDIELEPLDLQGTYLSGGDLRHADLQLANLHEVNFRETDLSEAILLGADLSGAYVRNANLYQADLKDAILLGADLQDADLQDADLQGANLQDANLQDANVTDEQLADAISLRLATMPDGSEHP
jgi:hypothetical protein